MANLSLKQTASVSRASYGAGLPLSAVSISLFVAVLAAVGGLFVLNGQMKSQKEELIRQNEVKEESLRPELLEQIIALEDRLKGIRALLARHPYASNVFQILEADTHPQVKFTSFSFSSGTLKADLAGEALNYRVLARQIAFLERDPQVEDVQFGGLSVTGPASVGFRLTITFKPTFLHIRQP